jgi:mRNA interferase MazF
MEMSPHAGHEQAGHRPALVISPSEFNRTGMVLVCPITNQIKGWVFEVPMPTGQHVTGVALANQLKSLDWRARNARFFDAVGEEVVNAVVEKCLPLLDPHNVFTSGPESPTE